MKYPERLPVTKDNRQFPIGDIDNAHRMGITEAWFDMVGDYDANRFVNYALFRSRPTSLDSQTIHDNHKSALDLCVNWDAASPDNGKMATLGFIIARAFIADTKLLPNVDVNLTKELGQMQTEQLHNANDFGRTALDGMYYSHPSIYRQYERLYLYCRQWLDLEDSNHQNYFQAGMVLPYLMAATARLDKNMQWSNITGMVVGTVEELEAMEFNDIFSSET